MNSHGRFLTTHVGSLPRPQALMQLMFAREDGLPFDEAELDTQVSRAVEGVVARQLQAGLDIINDGEMPKPSYATYVKDRFNGFGGSGNSYVFQDLEAYPGTKARMFSDEGRKHRKTPACNAPISVRDLEAPRQDARRLRGALRGEQPRGDCAVLPQ
jgi:5-methyltetrahydropteroyltriglutamate--homocysteine methyltransferase